MKQSQAEHNKDQTPNLILGATMLLIALLSFVDTFKPLTEFSRDPAPENTRILIGLLISLAYTAGLVLVSLRINWGYWITFSLYLISCAVYGLIIGDSSGTLEKFYPEIIIRIILFFGLVLPYLKLRALKKT